MRRSSRSTKAVAIGCGAGFADDRADAGLAVVDSLSRHDGPRYLIFETVGERTLALAQLERRHNPAAGFSDRISDFLRPILRDCRDAGIRIVANFGSANPMGAGEYVRALGCELDIPELRVAVVEGDDLLDSVSEGVVRSWPVVEGIPLAGGSMIAANVYLGAAPIAHALLSRADVVIVGRSADSALALGPLMHEFEWSEDDWDHLAAGTLAGHLLECGSQISGGYFADPRYKDVPDLADIGFPIVLVSADGAIIVTKAEPTGGLVSPRTVKEQVLYEIHDPAAYLVPDVTLDMTAVEITSLAANRVLVTGARGHRRPATLKATVSTEGDWLAEGEISYAGHNALARAELAVQVLQERLRTRSFSGSTRLDIIGVTSTLDSNNGELRRQTSSRPDGEYRVRLAASADDPAAAREIAREVAGLYTSGPAGGAGVRCAVTPRVRTASVLVDRLLVDPRVRMLPRDEDAE